MGATQEAGKRRRFVRLLVLFVAAAGLGLVVSLLTPVRADRSGG